MNIFDRMIKEIVCYKHWNANEIQIKKHMQGYRIQETKEIISEYIKIKKLKDNLKK